MLNSNKGLDMRKLKQIDQDRKRQKTLLNANKLEDLILYSFSRNKENCFIKLRQTYKVSEGRLIKHSYNKKQ